MDLVHGLTQAIERQGAGALRRLLLVLTKAAIHIERVVPARPLLRGAADIIFNMDDAHLATILHANNGLLVIFCCKLFFVEASFANKCFADLFWNNFLFVFFFIHIVF